MFVSFKKAIGQREMFVFTLGVFTFLLTKHTSVYSTFCPVTAPNGEAIYATDTPLRTTIALSKTACATQCAFSSIFSTARSDVCLCFNYNATSNNCSLFNRDPEQYAVDPFNSTTTYQAGSSITLHIRCTQTHANMYTHANLKRSNNI